MKQPASLARKAPFQSREQCALCQRSHLIRKSHIIPEFLYSPLYDELNRFKSFGRFGDPKQRIEQKGYREPLLCDDCEQRFSGYERVAAIFYQGALRAVRQNTEPEFHHGKSLKFTRIGADGQPTSSPLPSLLLVEGIDYVPLKLFQLSLLWRMGVSSLNFFKNVELGPHEERIRNMLLKDEPGEPHEYGCEMRLVTGPVDGGERLITDFQSEPRRYRQGARTFYRLFSTGVRFDFCVNKQHPRLGAVEVWCIKRRTDFCWCVDSIEKHPDLRAEMLNFGKAMGWV